MNEIVIHARQPEKDNSFSDSALHGIGATLLAKGLNALINTGRGIASGGPVLAKVLEAQSIGFAVDYALVAYYAATTDLAKANQKDAANYSAAFGVYNPYQDRVTYNQP